MRQKDPGVLHKQFSLPPSLVARTQHRRLSCDRALSCACWGEPPPASLRGWCSEVTLLGRRALCCVSVCVCGCLPALNGKKACAFFGTCAFYYYLFFWLYIQFKELFLMCVSVQAVCTLLSRCMFAVQCTVLYFQPLPPRPLPVPRPTSAPWRCVGVREYGERNTGRPHSTTWKEF